MTETEVIKPFNELTSVEVNDLIATEIMGWHEDPAHSLTWWSGEKPNREKTRFYGNDMFLDWASDDQPDTSSIFNPYESLDDCYLAEEKLKEGSLSTELIRMTHQSFANHLYSIR